MKAYLKLELNFFEAPVYMEMRAIEGCTGEGCVLALMRYLRTCPKGTGYLAALKNIAHDCRKSKTYLMQIISDYKIFEIVDQKFFYCPYLEHSLFVQHSTNNQFTPSQVLVNQGTPLYTNNTNNTNNTDNTNHPTTEKKRDDDDDEKNKNHIAQPTPQQTAAPMPPSPPKQPAAAPKQAAAANEQVVSAPEQPASPSKQAASANEQVVCASNDSPRPATPPSAADCQHELRRLNACNKPVKAMTLNAYPHASTSHELAEKKAKLQKCEQDILNHLYGDAAFMMSLQSLTGLCVYRSAKTRYYCLQWFRMIRHSQGKPIVDEEDAKRHLLALLQKGRKTRNDFHRWHNDQLQP